MAASKVKRFRQAGAEAPRSRTCLPSKHLYRAYKPPCSPSFSVEMSRNGGAQYRPEIRRDAETGLGQRDRSLIRKALPSRGS